MNTATAVRAAEGVGIDPNGHSWPGKERDDREHHRPCRPGVGNRSQRMTTNPRRSTTMNTTTRVAAGDGSHIDPYG